eukprot:2336033-Prymnesium_polylepis.3
MNRVFHDGHEVDGYYDSEMQRHPIVRAHMRRSLLASGSNSTNSSNCTNANTGMGCADVVAPEVVQHLAAISYTTEQGWGALTTATLDAIAQGFASFFSVNSSAVSIQKGISSSGATNDVQVCGEQSAHGGKAKDVVYLGVIGRAAGSGS